MELLNGVFNFHPKIYEEYESDPKDLGRLRRKKLHYHIRPDDESDDDFEDVNEHDLDEKPCLNQIFGTCSPGPDEKWKNEDSRKFFKWLQPIMCPSVSIFVGDGKLNPIVMFMLTHLAPGWVGGALTGAVCT